MSFIPTPFEVGGNVVLEAKPGHRRTVTTPIAGWVDWIDPTLQPGTVVCQGQPIAKLRSRELEQAITQVEQDILPTQQQQEDQARRQQQADAEVQAAIAPYPMLRIERGGESLTMRRGNWWAIRFSIWRSTKKICTGTCTS